MNIEKELLETVVASSMNKKECFVKLGLHPTSNASYRTLGYYLRLYNINTDHFISYGKESLNTFIPKSTPLNEILEGKHPLYGSSSLRPRLIKEGYMEHKCSVCMLSEWQGQPIPLDLDHINGIPTDHRLENIRLICRNCHAQTDNFCGKNMKSSIAKKHKDANRLIKDKNKLEFIKTRINLIMNSNIDFSKYGWVTKISEIINITPQRVTPWMKRHMTEFYHNNCFKR